MMDASDIDERAFGKADLTKILSALAGEPRRPANSAAALKGIEKVCAGHGLKAGEVLRAAGPLVDGLIDRVDWVNGMTWAAGEAPVDLGPMPDPSDAEYESEVAAEADFEGAPEDVAKDALEAIPEAELSPDTAVAALEEALPEPEPVRGVAPPVGQWLEEAARRAGMAPAAVEAIVAALEPGVLEAATAWSASRAKPARTPRQPRSATERKPRGPGKEDAVIALMRRDGGATMDEITAATGWLPHTARAAISVGLRKKRGLAVLAAKGEDGRTAYRIEG